jgi:hypothetical protein
MDIIAKLADFLIIPCRPSVLANLVNTSVTPVRN